MSGAVGVEVVVVHRAYTSRNGVSIYEYGSQHEAACVFNHRHHASHGVRSLHHSRAAHCLSAVVRHREVDRFDMESEFPFICYGVDHIVVVVYAVSAALCSAVASYAIEYHLHRRSADDDRRFLCLHLCLREYLSRTVHCAVFVSDCGEYIRVNCVHKLPDAVVAGAVGVGVAVSYSTCTVYVHHCRAVFVDRCDIPTTDILYRGGVRFHSVDCTRHRIGTCSRH